MGLGRFMPQDPMQGVQRLSLGDRWDLARLAVQCRVPETLRLRQHPKATGQCLMSCAGATYWRLGSDSAGGSFDRLASLWFVASCMVLQPGNNACTIM